MRNKNIKVELDEKALDEISNQIVEDAISSGNLDGEIECPACGRMIKITGRENQCECGFVIEAKKE